MPINIFPPLLAKVTGCLSGREPETEFDFAHQPVQWCAADSEVYQSKFIVNLSMMSTEIDNDGPAKFLHSIYTNDPLLFKNYVNKQCSITTEDGIVHTGIVYTVDPVSESIVLMEPQAGEERMRMKIIMRPAITNIDYSHDIQVNLPEMFGPPPIKLSKEEINRRKASVIKLLLENRFPITEEKGVICIEDTVQIEPPYQPENCICLNSIILNRIQGLLARITD